MMKLPDFLKRKKVVLYRKPYQIVRKTKLDSPWYVVKIHGFDNTYMVDNATVEAVKNLDVQEIKVYEYRCGVDNGKNHGTTWTDLTETVDYGFALNFYGERTFFKDDSIPFFVGKDAGIIMKVLRTLTHETNRRKFVDGRDNLKALHHDEKIRYTYLRDGDVEISKEEYEIQLEKNKNRV